RDVDHDPVRIRAPPAKRPTQASGGDHLAPVHLSRLADDVQPLTGRDLCVCHAPPPSLRRAACASLYASVIGPNTTSSQRSSPCASERRAASRTPSSLLREPGEGGSGCHNHSSMRSRLRSSSSHRSPSK